MHQTSDAYVSIDVVRNSRSSLSGGGRRKDKVVLKEVDSTSVSIELFTHMFFVNDILSDTWLLCNQLSAHFQYRVDQDGFCHAINQ